MAIVGTNLVNSSPAPDPAGLLRQERQNRPFDLLKMHQFIEGSEAKSNLVLLLYQSLERDPVIKPSYKDYELSTDEHRVQTTRRIERMTRYIELEPIEVFNRRLNLVTMFDPSLGIRISVNLGLYINCIRGNGTPDQYRYWCVDKEARHMKQLYGCFGMTELGHGSNVAGCETTAVFDEATDEFIINTPHIGATKWWIGGAAHSATHSSIYARLIVKGKDYGVKTFVVPLRDSNHDLLPGVSIGDIGHKMGRLGVDNGWIQFSSVRIPRFFMLQRFCKVSRDGTVELPPLEQLSYISLLGGRVGMAVDLYRICARFVTIALRYAVARRQFASKGNTEETLLLDYPLHQKRLLPYLALAYVLAVGTSKLEDQHTAVLKELDAAIAANDEKAIRAGLDVTKSLFVDSGSLKASLTWLAADCIDQTRQACGGHGYSAYNGFGKTYGDWVVQCTWEGDNSVLSMLAGKTIVKNVEQVLQKGRLVDGTLSFLSRAKEYVGDRVYLASSKDVTPHNVLRALEVLMVRLSASALTVLKETDGDWDQISHERVILSKLRCHHYLLEAFLARLENAELLLRQLLQNVVQLYVLAWILEAFTAEFLLQNVMSTAVKMEVTGRLMPNACRALRPEAIILTDSFQQPDAILGSAIGNYNGDVYENYFGIVNAANPPSETKAPYSEVLETALNRPELAVRERHEKLAAAANILSK